MGGLIHWRIFEYLGYTGINGDFHVENVFYQGKDFSVNLAKPGSDPEIIGKIRYSRQRTFGPIKVMVEGVKGGVVWGSGRFVGWIGSQGTINYHQLKVSSSPLSMSYTTLT